MILSDQRGAPLGRRRHGLLGGVDLGDAPPHSKKSFAFLLLWWRHLCVRDRSLVLCHSLLCLRRGRSSSPHPAASE